MRKNVKLFLLTALLVAFSFAMGNSAFATLKVNVMPSGAVSQPHSWDSKGPYTWPGNTLELWGNVNYDGANALTYTWAFGGAEGSVSGNVTNRDNISVTHAYASSGSYVATLTVTDGTQTDTDTVFIDVVPVSLDVRVNLAIQKGLKRLYLDRRNTTVDGIAAHYWGGSQNPANSAMAVLAFENHGHLAKNDPNLDIYAETVSKGLNYLFNLMRGQAASNPANQSSADINNNGRAVYCYTTDMYHVGMTTMAIAGTADPDAIVGPAGSAEVEGKTYRTVLEDMVDFIAYAQEERTNYSGYGGWRYTPNYGSSDNSVGQWPLLGLGEAGRAPWNIQPPAWVKTNLIRWINYDQNANGGFGYESAGSYPNIAKTGAGIAMMAYAGSGGNMNNAVNFINTYWNTDQGGWLYHYHLGYHYAMYGVKKGMEFANLSLIGAHDWQEEYNQYYVNWQNANGSWPGSYWVNYAPLETSTALLVLAPLEACKPVADAGADKETPINQAVSFNGSNSYHTCPQSNSIVTYEWDFDYNGVNFTVDATGAMASKAGYVITNGTDTQLYTVALRVTDNQSPAGQSIDTLVVKVTNGNIAPVADPGGPYVGAVGADVVLDGSGSYDDNQAGGSNPIANPARPSGFDEIVSYKWDTDGDGLYGDEDSPADKMGISPTVNFGTFMGTKTIGLKVTDSFGKTAAQSVNLSTVALSDIAPIGYVETLRQYNRLTGKWTIGWKLKIQNSGTSAATAVKAKLTPGSIPAGVTVLDDNVSFTLPDSSIDPGEIQTSDDDFRYVYSRTTSGPDLTKITWDIELTDALGTRHIIRNIPQ